MSRGGHVVAAEPSLLPPDSTGRPLQLAALASTSDEQGAAGQITAGHWPSRTCQLAAASAAKKKRNKANPYPYWEKFWSMKKKKKLIAQQRKKKSADTGAFFHLVSFEIVITPHPWQMAPGWEERRGWCLLERPVPLTAPFNDRMSIHSAGTKTRRNASLFCTMKRQLYIGASSLILWPRFQRCHAVIKRVLY